MVTNVGNAIAAYRQTMGGAAAGKAKPVETAGSSFEDTLKTFLGDAVKSLKEGEKAAAEGALGKANLQEVVIAVSNAEIMMQTVTAVRDKVINAYQEIIRTTI